jgi:ubiquinone/menaquinone biosynthesis C-methylase UbiE
MIPERILKKNSLLLIPALILIAQLTGCANGKDHKHTPASQLRFDNIEMWVKVFEDPKRDEWQQPQRVIREMNLRQGDVIADIGAGTGYFTRRFAVAVGPEGRALGLDIEASMIQYMKDDARKLNLDHYEARIIDTDDPGLDNNSVDVIFLCNTYHHIEDRINYFQRSSESLKPGGRLVIVDFYKKQLPYGPPPEHKLSKQVVIDELQQAGYKLNRESKFLPYQYFLEFVF